MDKLVFSEDSWHFKLNKRLYTYVKGDSLCVYFWRTVLAIAIWVFIAIVACFFIFSMLSVFFQFVFPSIDSKFANVGAVIWVILLLGFRSMMMDELRYIRRHQYQGEKDPWWGKVLFEIDWTCTSKRCKSPSLFWAWLKAKKEKVCPQIEWTAKD
jgi:hypothetical protein